MTTRRRWGLTFVTILALAASFAATSFPAPAQSVDDVTTADLAVHQVTVGASGIPFRFGLSDGATPPFAQQAEATTTADGVGVDVTGLGGPIAAGTYTLGHAVAQPPAEPAGGHWEFTGVECDGAAVVVDAPNATATITLEPGAAATCVVTDTWVADGETASPTTDTNPSTNAAPAAPTPTDDDGDGIAAPIEDGAPNGGDGNSDGLVDSRQANVGALPAAIDANGNGTLDDYVAIVAPEGTMLTNVRALEVPSDNPPPDGVSLPYGLFEYEVTVASPGDTADVTYVLPDEGAVPTSVHMLQNGAWTDYADHTSLDPVNGEVTVALRDGGEGDETGAADGVIKDPSGLSTSNQTISVTNVSSASAPNFTFRLERCSETFGTGCTGATAVGTTGGSANASGDSAALGNGSSWFWGSPTALEYGRNYRLSVITPLPFSGWRLTGRNCDPDGNATAIVGLNAMVLRLDDSTDNRRAACPFTFTATAFSSTITALKGGLRNTASNAGDTFATGLQGATFEFDDNSAFSSPSDLCVAPVSTDSAGVCVSAQVANGNYWVREKAAPAGWNTIPVIAYGGDAFGQSPNQPYNQQVNVANSSPTTRRFVNRRSNPALTAGCGLNISLVLDRSGSTAANATGYANAAKSFVNSLALTPSQMKIFSFAATATANQNTFVSLSTQAGVNSLNSTIDAVYTNPQGGTNWDAGLQLAINSGSNLVVFITDGNPTARNGDTGSTNLVNLEDVEYGIASANSVKNANQTIWAVGVANPGGSGITATNLELVSGPGDFFTANLDQLQETLRILANQLCGSRIHVRKLVGGQPQAGWQFTAAGGGAPVTFGNNPATTLASGENVIGVDNIPATGTAAPVTVTESLTGHAGFSFDTAACQLNSYPAAGIGTPINPQSIAQIQRNQDWFCTFNNKAASSTATVIHNAAGATVTSVAAGTVVHDQATVTGQPGLPVPTGTVTFSWFTNGDCSGTAAATAGPFTLVNGAFDATAFTQTPAAPGSFAFRASYAGNTIYAASTGPCEPLTVTQAASSTATVIHDANHVTVLSVAAGTVVHDQATVTGQPGLPVPTGTVTFSWFTNGDCSGTAAATAGPFTLVNGAFDATAFTQTPAAPGSFAFRASYAGNTIYAASTGPCEPLTVTQAASSTATVIHDANHVTVLSVAAGTVVHDQATVTGQPGLPVPTGTVTFSWFTNGDCSGTAAATAGPFTLVNGAFDATAFTQTPAAPGSFAFRASYAGNTIYAASTGPCEPLTVTQAASSTATVIHDANHVTVLSVAAGTVVHDQATVTGQPGLPVPTGTVTFSWFTNGDCSGTAAATAGPFTLVNGAFDATAFTQTPAAPGSFAFRASYAGNTIYAASTGPCEPLTVTQAASSTATVIHDANHVTVLSVAAGTVVHDQATVTGQPGLPVPTGTVTFSWFTNGDCSGTAAATAGPFTLVNGAFDATAFTQTPAAPGSFAFRASYAGNTIYAASTGPCEPLTVTQAASSTATVIHDANHVTVLSVAAGTVVHDQATVTGQPGLPVPTGTVTFSWFTNGDCSGTAAATAGPFTLVNGAFDATAFTQTPAAPGSFAFRASYAGNTIYAASTGPCEPLTVTQAASSTATVIHDANHVTVLSVAAGTVVHDQATVTGQPGLPVPTGTVTFSWFTNGDCSGTAAATAGPFTLVNGAFDATAFTQTPAAPGSFAFRASYAGNTIYAASTGPCEPLTVTQAASSTATVIHDANHVTVLSVAAGTVVHDQATVTGQVGLPVPTGTVTLSWFTNGTCTAPATDTSSAIALSGGAVDATGFPQTPSSSGMFAFQATYGGDAVYIPSTGVCEPLTVTTAASTTATVIHDTNHAPVLTVPAGTVVHDQATVTGQVGLPVPTGTVTLSWFTNGTCTAPATDTSSAIALSGGAVDATGFPQTPAAPGSFAFQATYSGDTIYAASTGACEPLTVTTAASTTATVIHDTNHAPVLTVPAGTVVHDQATVTGQVGLPVPTGTVTLSWFTNGTCTAPATDTSSAIALTGGAVDATGFPQTPAAPGSFAFQATYSGDTIYAASTGACEPLTVTTAASTTATVIHDTAHAPVLTVPAGTVVHDQATVTGQVGLPVPTGTVTLSWFTNGTCTAPATDTSSAIALTGGAVDATGFPQTPAAPGSFAFQATYSGDTIYAASTGPCEPLMVTQAASTTATVIHDTAHAPVLTVPAGTVVHDQATVTGQPGLPVPTGTVTFSWFTNGTCTAPADNVSGALPLNLAGIADGAPNTPLASGMFAFRASYSGDGTYAGSTGACEPLTVTPLASTTVTVIHDDADHAPVTSVPAGTTVHDQATVTGALGTPTGTVTFSWFTNGACTGTAADTSDALPLTGGAVDATGFPQTPVLAGSYAFQATYVGDGTYDGSTGPCEPLTVTPVASSTATVIHDTNHAPVTSVAVGTTVHDQATVTGQVGLPAPTGLVVFSWFTNGTCTGQAAATSDPFTLSGGAVDATTFTQTPVLAGSYAFQASYVGDGTYDGSTGPCEPLVTTPQLTLVKQVVNDDGGTAVDTDWTLSADGPTPISGATGSAAVTAAAVDAGSYALSESSIPGYAASEWSCVGGTQTGASVALALGESAICTIVNDDIPAQLTLVKEVINDHGGTAVPADWTLDAQGPTPISGATGTPAVTNAEVFPGTYEVTESGPAEYVPTTFVCVGGIQNDDSITLALGESATCTITNDDIEAEITLGKTSSATMITPGSQVPYTFTVTNVSQATAANVIVTDPLPEGLTFVSSPDGCTAANPQNVTCNVGTLAPGAVATRNIVTLAANPFPSASVDPDGLVPNRASVTAPDTNCPPAGRAIRTTPAAFGPLQATEADCESTLPLPVLPTIAITKTSVSTSFSPGGLVPYVITVTNTGPVVARNVVVTDDLPVGLSFVSSVPSCTAAGQLVTCPLGDLVRGATANIDLVTRAADPFPTESLVNGEIVNVAIVSGIGTNCDNGSTDPVCTDNWALPSKPQSAGAADTTGGSLPFTGAAILWLLVTAVGAIAAGVLLLCVPRIPAAGRRTRFARMMHVIRSKLHPTS